jgi:hypothetical protein
VRFLGRRVYAAVVVLAASVSALVASGVPQRTLGRWLAWWRGAFIRTPFFRVARARLAPALDEAALPGALIERFLDRTDVAVESALLRALSFVSPLSAAPSFSRDGP